MSAYCHYEISPPWSLDQSDTYSAIEEFQYFLQMFPSDTARLRECNKLVDLLHKKLEKKAYKTAVMYYDIAEYKAAIAAFDLVLHNYPDTRYREEAIFIYWNQSITLRPILFLQNKKNELESLY